MTDAGRRCPTAMSNASRTSSVRRWSAIASAVPKMLVNGRSENALVFDGIFFESSLKSIFFAS